MNIIIDNGNKIFDFIKDKVNTINLSPLQKKVAKCVLAYFCMMSIVVFLYRRYSFKVKKNIKFPPEPHQNIPIAPKSPDQVKPLKNDLLNPEMPLIEPPVGEDILDSVNPLPDDENPANTPLTNSPEDSDIIKLRIQKNLLYANKQQVVEHEEAKFAHKHFKLSEGPIPSTIIGRTIDKETFFVNLNQVGISSCQGIRDEMEDEHLAVSCILNVNGVQHKADVFGVFDGHGGANASEFVKKNLIKYLKDSFQNTQVLSDKSIYMALKSCFKNLGEDYKDSPYSDGTTATVAMILNNKIWVANVGDSRTILVNEKGVVVQATEDAEPEIARFRKKIERLGGEVTNTVFTGPRVNNTLGVARAIGDKDCKGSTGVCSISSNPKITCYSLNDFKNGFLVLACDGLYDVATSNEVGHCISRMNTTPVAMAERLVHSAIAVNGSRDNVSVMVVKLL